MEILSYVVAGSLGHKDSMGHQEVLGPNEIQRMSAGTGVIHSEFNASETEPVHFLQIWIQPATLGTSSSYEQIRFAPEEKKGRLKLLAGPQGGDGVAQINQDAKMFVADLSNGERVDYELGTDRHAWLHIIRGSATVNNTALKTGDAAAVSAESSIAVTGTNSEPTEILLFDLA
jgi:redox-sensitive bicupin YhaK (pirin superfamily)